MNVFVRDHRVYDGLKRNIAESEANVTMTFTNMVDLLGNDKSIEWNDIRTFEMENNLSWNNIKTHWKYKIIHSLTTSRRASERG